MMYGYSRFLVLAMFSSTLFVAQITAYSYTFRNKTDQDLKVRVEVGIKTRKEDTISAGQSKTIVFDGLEGGLCLVQILHEVKTGGLFIRSGDYSGCGNMTFELYLESGFAAMRKI